MDVVDEAALAIDLEDGDPLAVLRLELRVAVDRDLAQLESDLVAGRVHTAAGRLAEMAARRGIENDFGYG
jgi:hypothetical protein